MFNVSAPNEVSVGKSIDLNFVIDEVLGDSDFDISYAFTGVNAEFRNANNVVLQPNQNYDVDNAFTWTLKGTQQGTMELTFTVKNQFGVEKTKTIPIEVKPIDFDFEVEPVGTVFELGKPIPIRFSMDAPNVLTYSLSFSANTDGVIFVGLGDIQENGSIDISNNNFTVDYRSSLSGNSVINLTITASNGVAKTKSLNIQIQQKPEILSAFFDYGGGGLYLNNPSPSFFSSGCPRHSLSYGMVLNWSKNPNAAIVSVTYSIDQRIPVSHTVNFSPPLNTNSNGTQYVPLGCYNRGKDSFSIKATIADSDGNTSELFDETIKRRE